MKSFLSTFVVCLIFCVIVIFFLGGLLFSGGVWPLIFLIALLLTILVRTIASLDARIEQLEQKLGMSSEKKQDNTVNNRSEISADGNSTAKEATIDKMPEGSENTEDK